MRDKIGSLFLGVLLAWSAVGEVYAASSSAYAEPIAHAAFALGYIVMAAYAFIITFKAEWLDRQLVLAGINAQELMTGV